MTCSPIAALLMVLACHGAAAFDIDAHKITEAMAAVYTPMKSGGLELDLDLIPAYAAYVAKINITNIMPAGSNGESLSLTVPERKSLAEAWAKAGQKHGLRIYMHIGSESLVETIDLAKHAAGTAGISGILAMTPVYFKPVLETLHDFLAAVAGAAPELPFWFYHFPDDTGVMPGQAHAFLEYAHNAGKMPNLMGIKYTDYNLMDFQLCKQVGGGKYNMLFGRDEEALAALDLGADAAVSSTIQYSPTLRQALAAYKRGDMAAAKAAQMNNANLCSMFGQFESAAKNVQKNIMRMVGMGVGPSRLPKRDLSSSEYHDLESTLMRQRLIDRPNTSPAELV